MIGINLDYWNINMRLIEKLFLSNLTYALLVEEFTAIDDEKQEEVTVF